MYQYIHIEITYSVIRVVVALQFASGGHLNFKIRRAWSFYNLMENA
jgi:hypothetical protein